MRIWMIVVIVLISLLIIIGVGIGLWIYCSNSKRRKKSFPWLDRLGIPFAKEGMPDVSTLPRSGVPSRYVQRSAPKVEEEGNNNGYLQDELPPALEGNDDPFKRLDHIGIPRAKIERTSSDMDGSHGNATISRRRPPSTPLPSLLSDSSSQEDLSFKVLPSPPDEELEIDALPIPPPELTDDVIDLPPPPPELMVNNEPFIDIPTDYDMYHIEGDYENKCIVGVTA